jgi:hypothetical protein
MLLFLFDDSKIIVLERSFQNKNCILFDDYKWITKEGREELFGTVRHPNNAVSKW